MNRSITASLIGILVLVTAIGSIAHGKEITQQPRNTQHVYHNGHDHKHAGKHPEVHVDDDEEIERQKEQRMTRVKEMFARVKNDDPECNQLDEDSLAGQTDEEIRKILQRHCQNGQSRKKRFVRKGANYRWSQGIIPYTMTSNINEANVRAIRAAQAALEKNTCLKFYPRVGNSNADFGLDHDGYLIFVEDPGCWSYVGNLRWATGQWLSCCRNKYACIHELGHAIGLGHEHQAPNVAMWTRINWENIGKSSYTAYSQVLPETQEFYHQYDTRSNLHYTNTAFNAGGRITWTSLSPEITGGENTYYEYYDIALSHNCSGEFCADFPLTCENDGYISVLDGECTCMCPYGLDRSTGCRTTITGGPTVPNWPGGSYAMIATVDGCPGTNIFSEGVVTHGGAAATQHSSLFHLQGVYDSAETRMEFCVMDNGDSTFQWPAGVYCIQRFGGTCPDGFAEGTVQFDDNPQYTNSFSGATPDGVYGTDTLFTFCCRDDGYMEEEMCLPNQDPFALFMYGGECQPIAGMLPTKQHYIFTNMAGSLASSQGSHPTLIKSGQTFQTYICYYTPLEMNCGGVHALSSTNPSVVITSPNYPSNYTTATECNWLFTAPEGSTIMLNFNYFDVEPASDTCVDYLEMRSVLLGQPGERYCGDGMDNSIMSILNVTSVTFRSDLTNTWGGFNFTASAVLTEDLAYNAEDYGNTYRGNVNFTRNMKPCLQWNEVGHCKFNPYDVKYFRDGLEGNYCRNPGTNPGYARRPWCYTGYDPDEGCLRDYCDVTLKEKIFDTWENCTAGAFCEDNPYAFEGCAKTCADSLPPLPTVEKSSDISCAAPTIPTDGTLLSTPKTSYSVGETVEISCTATGQVVTASCLTDRSWNLEKYVCGACDDGWYPHLFKCYKHFNERLTYADAVARCEGSGGTLAPSPNEKEVEFLMSLREVMTGPLWLGADKIGKSSWQWKYSFAGQVEWFNWKDGQPQNDDCACITQENEDFEWKDEVCDMYYEFVCTKPLSFPTVCADRRSDCLAIFEGYPPVFAENSDFAFHECQYTAGFCNANKCQVPEAEGAQLVSTAMSYIYRGSLAEYECLPLYDLASGDLRRACQFDGKLTGSPPVCKVLDFADTPLNNVEIIARAEIGENKKVYLGSAEQFVINRRGEIKQWTTHSKYEGSIALQIWRPEGENRFEFIGQNILETGPNTAQTFDVFKTNRINVTYGDVIGIYYPGVNEGGVSFDYCHSGEGLAMKSSESFEDVTNFKEGSVYSFDSTTLNCRLFSITALISSVETYVFNTEREVQVGDRRGIDKRIYTGIVSDLYVPVDGTVVAWNYHSLTDGPVAFQVWKSNPDTSMTLLGQNPVTVEEGIHTVTIRESERIRVQQGDYLGVLYGNPRGEVSLINCEDPSEGTAIRSEQAIDIDGISLNTIYPFNTISCKRFNMRALILLDEQPNILVDGIDQKTLIASGIDLQISSSGNITTWQYHSVNTGDVALQIWRRMTDTRFEFVGQNWVTVQEGTHTIDVPEEDRITVMKGDFVGVYYGLNRGKVTMDDCDGQTQGKVVQTTAVYNHTDFSEGSQYVFGSYLSCKKFNINTTISVVETYVYNTDRAVQVGDRRGIDGMIYTGIVSDLYVPVNGTISGWEYHSLTDGPVAFQVWKLNPDTSMTLLGQNPVTVQEGIHTVTISESERIRVQHGNYLGVLYGIPRGQVSLINCQDPSEGTSFRSQQTYDIDRISLNTSPTLGTISCKRFNMRALIRLDPVETIEQKALIASGIDHQLTSSGNISAWHYDSASAGEMAFQIWRRVTNTSFAFVGQNLVTVQEGTHTIDVPEEDRITVMEGDLVGVYYGLNGGTVTMDDCDGQSQVEVVQTTGMYYPTDFSEGSQYDFGPYLSCKKFNINTTTRVESNDRILKVGDRRGDELKVFVGTIPDLYIPVSGKIVEWHYHCHQAGHVAFQIWKRNTDTNYTFVDQNYITAEAGFHHLTIVEAERMTVQKGDYIGIYYAQNRGQVSLFNCDDPSEGLVVKSGNFPDENFTPGQPYPFGPRITCKRFNFKAIIEVLN